MFSRHQADFAWPRTYQARDWAGYPPDGTAMPRQQGRNRGDALADAAIRSLPRRKRCPAPHVLRRLIWSQVRARLPRQCWRLHRAEWRHTAHIRPRWSPIRATAPVRTPSKDSAMPPIIPLQGLHRRTRPPQTRLLHNQQHGDHEALLDHELQRRRGSYGNDLQLSLRHPCGIQRAA